MIRTVLPAALFLPMLAMLAACGEEAAPRTVEQSSARAVSEIETAAGKAFSVEEETDLFDFTYGWPVAAGSGALAATLIAERDRFRHELSTSAKAARAGAQASGFPYRKHEFSKQWRVAAQTPRFLSMAARIYSYDGGAHGMTGFDSLVRDAKADALLQPINLFVSAAALDDAVRDAFCAKLDAQRAQKRGGPITRSDDPFSACIAPAANGVVVLKSSDGKAIDRLGFLVPPYNAGPYAEGSYDVTVPVTAKVIEAVKPAYRGGFALAAPE